MNPFSAAVQWLRSRPVRPGPTYSERATIEAYSAAAQALASYKIGKPTYPDRDPDVYDSQAYRLVALIFRCVNLISHAAGTAPLRVVDEAKDGEAIETHPLRLLMRQPNPQAGEAAFWSQVALRTAVAGFCVVEKERNRRGEVIGLWPLNSSWLRAVPRADSPPDWEYRIPGIQRPYQFRAEDVIPFRWADTPNGSPYGLGPVAIALRTASLISKMNDFLAVLMERGGVPLVGLIPDLMPGQQWNQTKSDEFLERFLERHGGIEKSAIPWIMTGIKDVKLLSFDMHQLAMTDIRDVSELEIVQAFGVPPTKAMLRVGLEHSDSRANAQVDDETFYRDTMVPLWSRFDDALTTSLLPDFEAPGSSIALKFDTSDIQALQEDRNAKAVWVLPAFGGSLFTNYMALKELGIPIPKGLPEYFIRSIAVEAIPAEDPVPEPQPVPPALQPGGDGEEAPDEGNLASRGILALGSGPTRRYAQASQNRKHIAKVAAQRYPSLRAFFVTQGKRVAEAVQAPVGIAALVSANGHSREQYAVADLDWAEEERLLARVLRPLHILSGKTAFQAAEDQIGISIDYDLSNPRILDVLDRLVSRAAGPVGMTAETRTTVDRIVTEALNEGVTIDDLAQRLTDQFEQMSIGRAQVIARTESMTGYGYASTLAYRETGVVDRVQLFDNSEHSESYGAADGWSCAERNGQIVSLDQAEFHIDSEHPNGTLSTAPVLAGEE